MCFLYQITKVVCNFFQVFVLAEANCRSCICSLFIVMSLICGAYFVGSAWLGRDSFTVSCNFACLSNENWSFYHSCGLVCELLHEKKQIWSVQCLMIAVITWTCCTQYHRSIHTPSQLRGTFHSIDLHCFFYMQNSSLLTNFSLNKQFEALKDTQVNDTQIEKCNVCSYLQFSWFFFY